MESRKVEFINHFGEAVLLKNRAYEALKQEILFMV